ncbi:MAG: EndoU domain-containing protein [Nitrosospira sp.]
MHNARFGRTFLAGLLAPFLFPLHALAEVGCATLPRWVALDNGLQMNQQHVFCGEWSGGRSKGFHSRPGGANPSTVKTFTVQDAPNSAGIYAGKWSYNNGSDKTKFSSMFPDNCSVEQVLNSISHASTHPDGCPVGAPGWVKCGPNRPVSTTAEALSDYCSKEEAFFPIGFAPPEGGRINTAFPIRQ